MHVKNHPPGPTNPWHLSKCLIWELATGLHWRSLIWVWPKVPSGTEKSPLLWTVVRFYIVRGALAFNLGKSPSILEFFLDQGQVLFNLFQDLFFLSFLFLLIFVWVFLIYRNIKSLNERIFDSKQDLERLNLINSEKLNFLLLSFFSGTLPRYPVQNLWIIKLSNILWLI